MEYENIETGKIISQHKYNKLSDKEKVKYKVYVEDNSRDIISILGGGLIGEDSDDEE